jgi:hypothetical protein
MPEDTRWRYANMVMDARLFARKQAVGVQLTLGEKQRLVRMPQDVRHAIRACQPERPRQQTSRLDQPPPRLDTDLPKHAWGFKAVIEAIARHAGCRPTTLYVWTQDLAQGTLQRQSVWRPKEDPPHKTTNRAAARRRIVSVK